MSIKPIDIQGIVPKTQQLSKSVQHDNNKHKDFIQSQNVIESHVIKKDFKRVNTSKSKGEVRTKKEGSNKGSNGFQKKENRPVNCKLDSKDSKEKTVGLGNIIDIKV